MFLAYRNQSIDLGTNQLTGFYIMATSVFEELSVFWKTEKKGGTSHWNKSTLNFCFWSNYIFK